MEIFSGLCPEELGEARTKNEMLTGRPEAFRTSGGKAATSPNRVEWAIEIWSAVAIPIHRETPLWIRL
jgi:hypothetical protein